MKTRKTLLVGSLCCLKFALRSVDHTYSCRILCHVFCNLQRMIHRLCAYSLVLEARLVFSQSRYQRLKYESMHGRVVCLVLNWTGLCLKTLLILAHVGDNGVCILMMVVEDHTENRKKKPDDGIKEWLDAVSQCCTLSRFNVLVGILESCIKWEKSAENAVCLVCCTWRCCRYLLCLLVMNYCNLTVSVEL